MKTNKYLVATAFLLTLIPATLLLSSCNQAPVYQPTYTAGYNQATTDNNVDNNTQDDTPSPTPSRFQTVSPTPHPDPTPEIEPRENPCFLCPSYDWIASLTLREKIGQLIMPRLPWQTTHFTPALEAWLAEYPVGGIILFADNVQSIQQVQALTAAFHEASNHPLLIATDEEGGRVSRVGRLFDDSDFPIIAAYDIGLTGDPQVAYTTGYVIAQQLITLGINMNFAPVADVWTNPANTVIGTRAFAREPYLAGLMVENIVRGLNSGGVLSTIKHFPGHGDTYEDSHYLLAFYPHDRDRFDQIEAPPFLRGIEAGTQAVMIGHLATPEFNDNQVVIMEWMPELIESGTLPATFSRFWLQHVLRDEMGFDGLIITDALEMRALSDHFTPQQIAITAFLAGADILLMPTDVPATFNALLAAFEEGIIEEERLHASLRRIYLAHQELAES